MKKFPSTLNMLLTSLGLVLAAPVAAVDGLIEINHHAIIADGGYPFGIGKPGSFILTSNLEVQSANTDAIVLSANDITIDLNGFTISGPATCSRVDVGGGDFDTSCTGTGTGKGIRGNGAARVTVKNGTIRGMGNNGIDLQDGQVRIEDLKLIGNGGNGATLFSNSMITGCLATLNGGSGFTTGDSSLISGNSALQNGVDGFGAGSFGQVISGNIARQNDLAGIRGGIDSILRGNVAHENDNFGLVLSVGTGYTENSINDNGAGTVSGGFQIGQNICNANATCP